MRALLLVGLVSVLGCAPDLRDDFPFDGQVTEGPLVTATDLEGGGKRLQVDATNKMSQVYVDLDEARELKAEEAFSTNAWDLSFSRFNIAVNSGASAPEGTVEVAVLKDVPSESVTQAPATGFTVDTPDKVFNSTEGGWYFYDLGVHKLVTRAELVYVLKTSAGAYMKLRMLDYYDANGTPASLSLEYAPISAP
ncbi:MAG TPA: HmuY family protein [Archangium sp.]